MNRRKSRLFSSHLVGFHPVETIPPCKITTYNIPYPELTFIMTPHALPQSPVRPSRYGSFCVSGATRLASACLCSAGKSAMAARIDAKSLRFLSTAPPFAPPRSKSPLFPGYWGDVVPLSRAFFTIPNDMVTSTNGDDALNAQPGGNGDNSLCQCKSSAGPSGVISDEQFRADKTHIHIFKWGYLLLFLRIGLHPEPGLPRPYGRGSGGGGPWMRAQALGVCGEIVPNCSSADHVMFKQHQLPQAHGIRSA